MWKSTGDNTKNNENVMDDCSCSSSSRSSNSSRGSVSSTCVNASISQQKQKQKLNDFDNKTSSFTAVNAQENNSNVEGKISHNNGGDNHQEVSCSQSQKQKIEFTKNIDVESNPGGDSGFLSGPQDVSAIVDEAEIGDIQSVERDAVRTEENSASAAQAVIALDSGCIDEEIEEDYIDDGHKQLQQQITTESSTTDGGEMILDKGVDSGISEWFCKISLRDDQSQNGNQMNNLGAGASELSSATAASAATSIAASSAWEQYYQQDENGNTALHSACYFGYVDDIAVLIRLTPHPSLFDIKNDATQTGLHLAVLAGHPKILRMLLIAGADSCVRDRRGNTALHLACNSGDLQCVKALTIPISTREINEAHRLYGHQTISHLSCANLPTDLEIVNYDGENCVHIAAYKGHIEVLRHLVNYGVNINARDWLAGRTPLHIAIECRNEVLANYLLEDCGKLNLETKTYGGCTAYQFACTRKDSKLLNDLEKHGAEPLSPPESECDSSESEAALDEVS